MFSINLGISLKSGKQPKDQILIELLLGTYFWVLYQILTELLLGIFSFLVLFLCFHEFQFHILFCFDFFFFFWLSIWVIREEEGLLDKKRKAVEQTQVKKGEGFYGDCWTVGVLHAQQRWLFDLLFGFSIGIT